MTHCIITYSAIDGFDAVEVDTGVLSLALIPELGGKISTLRDRRTGREWLWRNPRLPYQRLDYSRSYVLEADTGGWDECFPSVAPCHYPMAPWLGVPIQDHGELWSQTPVVVVEETASGAQLHATWQGRRLPYTFERTIHLQAGSACLRCEYLVTNKAAAPLSFIWSMHPLLAIEPGMQLLFPPDTCFNRWASIPNDLITQDSDLRYPLTLQLERRAIDLKVLPGRTAGIALKLWSNPLREGWARVQAADGTLQIRWDTAKLPQVAFWMNLGGGAPDGGEPYYNLGLEPCIGAQDSLADAVTKQKVYATVPANGTYDWALELELEAGHGV